MGERLTDERLIGIQGGLTFIGPNLGPLYEDLKLAIDELCERRAQDLTDQEIEAIRYLRFFVDELHNQDGFEQEHYALADIGRAVLDKLLARRAP